MTPEPGQKIQGNDLKVSKIFVQNKVGLQLTQRVPTWPCLQTFDFVIIKHPLVCQSQRKSSIPLSLFFWIGEDRQTLSAR